MTISHRIARKVWSGRDYDMDYFTYEMKVEDLPETLRDAIPPSQQWRIMQYVVQRECALSQLQSGYLSAEAAAQRFAYLRECLTEGLREHVDSYKV